MLPTSANFSIQPQPDRACELFPKSCTFMKMDTVGRANGAKYECLLFDLDDTLYPLSIGFNLACRKNIQEFMLKYLDIEESEVARMYLELYIQGALGYEFDNDEFHAYAHGRLPYETLRPDPVLRNLLLSMPQRKMIFTNGDKAHAQQVLKRQRYGRAKSYPIPTSCS
ncbi:hypothetical protein V6N13_015278 [Hibiscus sabdariffa]|uniref:Uncharacterized protein n=2 Tax=Hibiscus sabdariffa TaxID=183260 RepID=A0ABR2AG03_9ROSI